MKRNLRNINKKLHYRGCDCGCNAAPGAARQLDPLQVLEVCIDAYKQEKSQERFAMLVRAIILNISENTVLVTPVEAEGVPEGKMILTPDDNPKSVSIYGIRNSEGEEAYGAFTSKSEAEKMPYKCFLAWPLWGLMQLTLENPEVIGLVINPAGSSFFMPREFMKDLLDSLKQKQ